MEFFSDCSDSPTFESTSPSSQNTSENSPPRGIEGLRRKLKLQQISSAKISFLGRQLDSNDDIGSAQAPQSSTLKRKFLDFYTPLQTIGQGSCGIVKKVQSKEDDQIYVAKIIRGRDQEHIDQIKREFQILSRFQHKNIVKAKELLVDEVLGHAQLILEYVPGKTLEELIIEKKQLEEETVRHILEQLISALKHVHDKGVCHRDISATNIIINENFEVKLIDFSVSKIFRQELWSPLNKTSASLRKKSSPLLPNYHNFMLSNTGTSYYKAPEVVTNVPYNNSVDMWSVGVITFYALSGYKPFESEHLYDLYDKIAKAEYEFDQEAWKNVSNEAIFFVKACLKQFPFIRLSTKEALYHPWIRKIQLNMSQSSQSSRRSRSKHLSPPRRTVDLNILNNTKPRKSFVLNLVDLN